MLSRCHTFPLDTYSTSQIEFSKQNPCRPQVLSATFETYGSLGRGTSPTLLLPNAPCELSVSAGSTLSYQSPGDKGKDLKGSRERTPQISPEIEGKWEEAPLAWWMSPDFTLKLTSEHLVSPVTTIATRRTQVLLPLLLHTWPQAMRPCPMPLQAFWPEAPREQPHHIRQQEGRQGEKLLPHRQ